MRDYGRAQLVGQKTFGKGSVQELEQLSDGSSVKVTIAKWLTPNGSAIDQEGIEPDVKVEEDTNNDSGESESDVVLDKAVSLFKD